MHNAYLILNSLGFGGLAIFLYFVFKGLRDRINALKTLAEEQAKTLDAVRNRAEEYDRLSQTYKQAVADYEEMGKKLEAVRSQLVKELEAAIAAKNGELVLMKKEALANLDEGRTHLAMIPKLVEGLQKVETYIREQSKPGSHSWIDLLGPEAQMRWHSRATDEVMIRWWLAGTEPRSIERTGILLGDPNGPLAQLYTPKSETNPLEEPK